MRSITCTIASPRFSFEAKAPCQASPASSRSVRSGARARSRAARPARRATPPFSNVRAPARTVSASIRPWMSLVWRIWTRSGASAPLAEGAVDGVSSSGPDTQAASRRATRTARLRRQRPILELVEAIVETPPLQELAMRALFDDTALVQHDDAVDVLDRREAMRDDDRGPSPEQLCQRVLNQVLRLGVHRGRRLVQDEHDLGVEGDRAREGEELLLPHRQRGAPLRDHRVVARGEALDEAVRVHEARGLAHALVAHAGVVQADVRGDAPGEDERVLQDHADVTAEILL